MKKGRSQAYRCLAAFFAVLYLSVSSNLVFFALDWVAPMTKTVARFDFPCANHDCGCKTAEQCRTNCCCFPKVAQKPACSSCTRHKSDGPITVRVTYLSAARCSGQIPGDDQTEVKKVDWHLPLATSFIIPQPTPERAAFPEGSVPHAIFADPSDKVPI